MGKNTLNTTKLTGDVVNGESLMRIIAKSGDRNMLTWVHYQIALLNFIFGDVDRAAEEIKMARPLTLTPFSSVEVGFVVMLDGLIHLAPGKHESMSRARMMHPYPEKSFKKSTKSLVEVSLPPSGRTGSAHR
jgi:hypothetical protein